MHENKMFMSIVKFENSGINYEVKVPNDCLDYMRTTLETLKWEYTIDYNIEVVYLDANTEANND